MKRDQLPPIVTQSVGVVMGIFFVVFWAITGKFEPVLLGFAGTVYSLGWIGSAKQSLKNRDDDK